VIPKFELYQHQVEGAMFLEKHHYAILADEMGIGKSLQALTLVNSVREKTLVVCPAYLKGVWYSEINKFYPWLNECVEVISYAKLKDYQWSCGTNIVIADEAHYLSNPNSQRSGAFYNLILTHRPERMVLLTGSPIKNRVTEFFSLLALCGLSPKKTNGHNITEHFKNYYSFCNHFCNRTEFKIRGRRIIKYSGHRNLEDLRKFLQLKYLRRLAKDVLDLPSIIEIEFDLGKKDVDNLFEDFHAQHISTGKAKSALLKAPLTAMLALDLFKQESGPIVIFTDHIESQKILMSELRKHLRVNGFSGGTVSSERFQIVSDFQGGAYDILVLTIGSGSTGFTLTNASTLIFNDLPWVPGDISQAIKRINRVGTTEKSKIYYVNLGPMDAHITKVLIEKTKVIEKIL